MEDLADTAIRTGLDLGASYVDARIQSDIENTYTLKNGVPDTFQLSRMVGIGVRVIVKGTLGFASTDKLTKDSVNDIVKLACDMASSSSHLVKNPIRLSVEKTIETSWETKSAYPAEDVSPEEKFDVLLEIERALDPREVRVDLPSRFITLSHEIEEKFYSNSEGTRIHGKIPRINLWFFITGSKPGKGILQRWLYVGESRGWEAVKEWDPRKLVSNEVKVLGKILDEGISPPKGETDLVLGSEVVGIICHESCGHPQEADRILGREAAQAGESYLKPDMIGTRIGSDHVTVLDDPTLPKSFGYYLYDDEGVEARERVLIDKGVVANFLQNRETAAELGVHSNGAARAVAYSREPIIRMANTYMKPGNYDREELFEDLKSGVYIKTFMEWNIDDRRFNQRYVGLEAYLIQNGEIEKPVRNPVLEVTTPTLYSSVDAVSKTLEFQAATCGKGDPQQGAPVWTGGPEIRVRKLRLGGHEN
jgi:TldD protein